MARNESPIARVASDASNFAQNKQRAFAGDAEGNPAGSAELRYGFPEDAAHWAQRPGSDGRSDGAFLGGAIRVGVSTRVRPSTTFGAGLAELLGAL